MRSNHYPMKSTRPRVLPLTILLLTMNAIAQHTARFRGDARYYRCLRLSGGSKLTVESIHRYLYRRHVGTILSSPVIADQMICVGSMDGHLYALK